jgi:cell division inhibitor SulA/protein ImuA
MKQHNLNPIDRQPALQSLLQHPQIRTGREAGPAASFTPTGLGGLDPLLPEGWPVGGIVEILVPHPGVGELSLLMPSLARLSRERRWLAWVAPPHIPYAPALAAHGVDLSRVMLIHPSATKDALWAVEQALRSGTCGAVLAWIEQADFHSLRRLQLAAAEGQSLCLLFRPHRAATEASPATLRLRLEAIPEGVRAYPIKYHGAANRPLGIKLNSERPREQHSVAA